MPVTRRSELFLFFSRKSLVLDMKIPMWNQIELKKKKGIFSVLIYSVYALDVCALEKMLYAILL